METIKTLLIKPGKKPEVVNVADDLEAMQQLVDGYIQETIFYDDDVAFIMNEEGKLRGLPPNRAIKDEYGNIIDIIVGNFFLCFAPITSESFLSLSDEQIEKYTKMFEKPEAFFQIGNTIIAEPIE
jgi:hypothetical protein